MPADDPQWTTLEDLAENPDLVARLLARLREPAPVPVATFGSAI